MRRIVPTSAVKSLRISPCQSRDSGQEVTRGKNKTVGTQVINILVQLENKVWFIQLKVPVYLKEH